MDRKWWTLIAVCVGTFMLLLDVTIVNVALPNIQTSLKANFSDLQWVVDAYALTLAALLLTTGSLADLFGRRLLFVLGLVVFTISSLLSGLASDPLWLNLSRGAQGIGGAAMFSTSLALLGSAFQGRERGVAFGVWGAITGLAVAIGPVIGGALTSGISWRWIFLVNVPIGVIAVFISMLRVEESKPPRAQMPDLIGVVTFSGALGALVYALIKGNDLGWGSTPVLGCLIGSAALLVVFVSAELIQRERAMFDLSLLRKPTFTGGNIAAFALSGGLFALLLYITLYLQDVLGFSALQTGLRQLVMSGGILLTSTLAGRLTTHVPIRFLIAPGLLLVGVGLLLMRGLTAGSVWTHLIPGFIVAGAGTGLINPPLASTAIGVVPPERAGMASGINSTFRQIGIATGIAGLGALFSHTVRTRIVSLLSGAPHLPHASIAALAGNVASGNGARSALQAIPAAARGAATHAVRTGFVTGLNKIFLIGAILALVAALLTLLLIRSKDFEAGAARTAPASEPPGEAPVPAQAQAQVAPEASPSVGAPAAEADAEAAARDYAGWVERQIERHRAKELAAAADEARRLLNDAQARSDAYAEELRGRERELLDARERLTHELHEHLDSAAHHSDRAQDIRGELERLTGLLGGPGPASERPEQAASGDGGPADAGSPHPA
jgi:EmrB/QacA subfamily drug resistance transporter